MNNLEEIKILISNLEKLIVTKFDEIDKKLDALAEHNRNDDLKMNEIKVECQKMGSHINFVEDTYNILQTPLNYVKRSVERLMGSSSGELKNLPIKDKDTDV
jgi:hypothetical protein